MITRRGARPHICLRCQQTQVNRPLPAQPENLYKLNNTWRYQKYTTSRSTPVTPRRFTRKLQQTLQLSTKTEARRDDRTQSGKRRLKVMKNVERLDEGEGKSSKIIIIQDSVLSTYSQTLKHVAPEDTVPIDIMGQLGEEVGSARTGEVYENIDSLRPKTRQLSSWEELNEVVDQLSNGFTSAQLEQYMSYYRAKYGLKQPCTNIERDNEAPIVSKTSWRPGISDIKTHFDNSSTRGYLMSSRTAKQRYAIRLLCECWEVELPDLIDGVGQFELQVRKDILEILLSGNNSPLQIFHDEFLIIEKESLEIFRSRNVIRFTTTEARMPWIIQEIEKLIKRIQVRKILLGDLMPIRDVRQRTAAMLDRWTDKTFSDIILSELRRLTGVVITREAHGKILLASVMKQSDVREIPNDSARRLLLTSRPSISSLKFALASANTSLAEPVTYCQIEGLNWWCRVKSWYRWVNPIVKESEKSTPKQPDEIYNIQYLQANDDSKDQKIKLIAPLIISPPTEENPGTIWRTDYSTSTFATIGAVIHTKLGSQNPPGPVSNLSDPDLVTDFSSHVPNVTRLIKSAKLEKNNAKQEEIVLRFVPNPFFKLKQKSGKRKSISAAVLSALPSVEIIFKIEQKKAIYSHVKAIVRETCTDVMLPQEIVDIRFRQRITSFLVKKNIKSIRNFVANCELNLEPGVNHKIPPSIVLPISTHLCRDIGLDLFKTSKSKSTTGTGSSDFTSQSVEYLFAGLQFRKKLVFNYDSWRLEYCYIDAGKSGGKRGELSLRPIKESKGVSEQDFLNFGLELACRFTSLSTPDMTRFQNIRKIENIPIRRYVPLSQPTTEYPRMFMYTPRRILKDSKLDNSNEIVTKGSSEDILPDFEDEVRAFEDEIDLYENSESDENLDEMENIYYDDIASDPDHDDDDDVSSDCLKSTKKSHDEFDVHR
ncbi:unnamed protein product [Blumeria hordei]|uniref:Uncharacterized protein n=1 Tax=Blumeria hordei TaxID=2867405 RepID=A0A383UYU9_BLUHO|nr:unnamed protein product [Blumeria hordei]